MPRALEPQHHTEASRRSAQVAADAGVTCTTSVIVAATGVGWLAPVVPLPICPAEFEPQQRTVPSRSRAQTWAPPAASCVASATFSTRVGGACVRPATPSPSSPTVSVPQQVTAPCESRAHEKRPPAATPLTSKPEHPSVPVRAHAPTPAVQAPPRLAHTPLQSVCAPGQRQMPEEHALAALWGMEHTVPFTARASAGHAAEAPVQVSGRSQTS